MKRLYSLIGLIGLAIASQASATIVSESCNTFGSTASCDACFYETHSLYACNPHQASCANEAVNGMFDTVTNSGDVNNNTAVPLVMYDTTGGIYQQGSINFTPLQPTVSMWSTQAADVVSMFQSPAGYYTPAGGQNQTGYQQFASGRSGYYLNVGDTVRWVEMKSDAWLRADTVQPGVNPGDPAFRVTFTPRLFSDETTYIDHAQCVYYYVRYCGDGNTDNDRGEQCDDGNMTSGDGCSSTCQTETVTPTCNALSVNPTVIQSATSVTYSCDATNASSYTIEFFDPSNTLIQSFTTSTGSIVLPATPDGTYRARCTINGSITSAACEKTIENMAGNNQACTNLTVSPTSFEGSTNVFFSCAGLNVSSYNISVYRPDGSFFGAITASDGNMTIPATPDGTYTARCTVDGSITSAACEKTFENTPAQVTPTCNSLVASPSTVDGQTNVTFTCNASNASSYLIEVRNPSNSIIGQITSSSGVVTIPATPDGNYFARCTVNGTITNSNCTTNVTNNSQPQPEIEVIKDDNDNPHNDHQVINNGDTAEFTITVRNIGTESMNTVILSDTLAPECNRSSTQTQSMYPGDTFDPGETFSYVCSRSNVQSNTFPNNENTICVEGRGVSSLIRDTDCDDTYIALLHPDPRIEIIKDDSDNHDDRQYLDSGDTARFDITVRNIGDEALENVVISDVYAADCERSSSSTRNMIDNVGNDDDYLDPGESFTYTCTRTNVQSNTFPNNQNEICVEAEGRISNEDVDDCDSTYIFTEDPDPSIRIIKDDDDNYDDRQLLREGDDAEFTIIVENNGDESLENVRIDDARAPDCARDAGETIDMYPGSTFDPGEKFSYRCDRNNAHPGMFPGNKNIACVYARGETSRDSVDDCDPTRIDFENVSSNPSIKIIKNDSDNHDDRQRIISGEAIFDIVVINDGDAPLRDLRIDDENAPECSRSTSRTLLWYPGDTFDPGERFTYTCRVHNAKMSDFPGGQNRACVQARAFNTSETVSDCDVTKVEERIISDEVTFGRCVDLSVNTNRGIYELDAEFRCVGNAKDVYHLDIMTGDRKLLKTIQSKSGIFQHKFGLGDYVTRCRVDKESSVRPECEERIFVEDRRACESVVSSNGSYGPAGFQTTIRCDASPSDRCLMQVVDKITGKVKSSFNACTREIRFKNPGKYSVRCEVNGVSDDSKCSTDITIAAPTTPPTGPLGIFIGVVVLLAVTGIAYFIRRKVG